MVIRIEKEKKLIPRELKKSVKLSLIDRKNIRGEYILIKSQRKLAKKYNVSRRLIQFILFPEKEIKNKLNFKKNQSKYYDKEKHKNYIAKTRSNRKILDELNLLINSKSL